MERRPLKVRGSEWAKALARLIAKKNITPNQISLMSVAFSAAALFFFYFSRYAPLSLLFAAAAIQLRALCNLFDGMVAVEHGKKTKSGEVFNDVPDRFSDLLTIVGVGLALPHLQFAWTLAWFAVAMAIMTAYVRVLGASLLGEHDFIGPMAKQHRFFVITVAAIVDYVNGSLFFFPHGGALYLALWILALGSTFTVFRRLHRIVKKLEERPW